jgi:hypothetical protein
VRAMLAWWWCATGQCRCALCGFMQQHGAAELVGAVQSIAVQCSYGQCSAVQKSEGSAVQCSADTL